MKEKILKAIDKGLMSVLSTDITDQNIEFDHDNIDNEYVPYETRTVDMGNAGVWCEYNLGAHPGNKASDWYGDYYAWGETETKDNYTWKTYKYCKGTKETLTKYNKKDRLIRLETNDDVVTQTLGKKFRMPTHEEYEKLINNTTNEWVKNYKDIQGLNGRLFTAKNGNTLFFPAAGYHYYYSVFYRACDGGYLWSASLDSNYPQCAFYLNFYSNGVYPDYSYERYYGFTVRGIQNPL